MFEYFQFIKFLFIEVLLSLQTKNTVIIKARV